MNTKYRNHDDDRFINITMKNLILFCLLYSAIGRCDDPPLMPLGGVYLDNLNHLNVKLGVALYERVYVSESADVNSSPRFSHLNFIYSDLEYGEEGGKVSIGVGQSPYGGVYRVGFSYGHLNKKNMFGVEGVLSMLLLSLKAGAYQTEDSEMKYMIGVGAGW